jgi:RNA-directed DNA polymerase
MTRCHPLPVTAAAGTAVAVSWAGRLESAYHWLCQARHTAHPNHPVWHFRWNWHTWKPRLLAHLKSSNPSYRFSPVRRVLTAAGERLECWEPQDSLMLKLLAEHLQPVLLPALSNHCHHLKGRGGVKRAVHTVRQTLLTGEYHHVARSDAKGYYANIQHTRLLELLRAHCSDPGLLDLASQYCGRTLVQDGYYHTVTKGISLGCPLSPLMGALYLAPLDSAMAALPGIRYTRFMDDWVILAKTRWQLRRAVRVMNQVLAHLGLEQHPDKTFIGRVTRGFDFLGVDFQPGAPLAPSAVSLARKTEKIARLHEQGASPERIGRDDKHWHRWLHRLIGQPTPAGSTPPGATPPPATPVRSLSHHSPQLRFTRAGRAHINNQKYDNENENTGLHRITTLRRGGARHRGCVRSQRGDGADHVC